MLQEIIAYLIQCYWKKIQVTGAGAAIFWKAVRVSNIGSSKNYQYNRRDMMKRKASALWQGDLKAGKGVVSTASGVLDKVQYSFSTRFEDGIGTNPEELIAAAHAGCFSMALSAQLGSGGMVPESISTEATLTMEKLDAGWTVTAIHLDVTAKVSGGDSEAFMAAAEGAKAGCPISRLLNTTITMAARLE
jgi:osmotically inducible protein OsmC